MNIIILGPMASGKSILAKSLAQHYRQLNQRVAIIEDDASTASRREHETNLIKTIKLLKETQGDLRQHIIIATQASPNMIYGFYDTEEVKHLYDYYIKTEKEPRREDSNDQPH